MCYSFIPFKSSLKATAVYHFFFIWGSSITPLAFCFPFRWTILHPLSLMSSASGLVSEQPLKIHTSQPILTLQFLLPFHMPSLHQSAPSTCHLGHTCHFAFYTHTSLWNQCLWRLSNIHPLYHKTTMNSSKFSIHPPPGFFPSHPPPLHYRSSRLKAYFLDLSRHRWIPAHFQFRSQLQLHSV